MAIIRKKIKNTTYVYEAIYSGIENEKRKYKWILKGKLDENGELIPSKKRNPEELPAETEKLSMTTTSENVENESRTTEADSQVSEEVKALAIPEKTEKPEEIEAEIVIDVATTRVDKYTFGTTKVEGIAFDLRKNEGVYTPEGGAINVSKNEVKRKEVNVMVSLNFNELTQDGVIIERDYRLTPFDRAVHNAIATLWEIGHRNKTTFNEYLTPRVIFQLLSGNDGESKDVSPEMRKAILRSVDKMKHTGIIIDASDEAKILGYKDFKHIGSLLEVERVESMKINGRKVEDCIHIFRSPVLYEYAKLKNQIGSINIKMLNVPKFRNTAENIELKEYLLQRIIAMKNLKSRMSETIRYETIYDYLRIEAATKASLLLKYKKVRDKVKKLLDFWKGKKLIKDYKEEKEGKFIAKVIIIY